MAIPEISMEKAMNQLRAYEQEVKARNLARQINLEPLRNAPPLPEQADLEKVEEEKYVYESESESESESDKKTETDNKEEKEESDTSSEEESDTSSEDSSEEEEEEDDDSLEVIRTLMSENSGSKLDLVYYKKNGVKMVNLHLTSQGDYETTLEEFKNILATLEYHNALDSESMGSEESELSLLEKARKADFYKFQFIVGVCVLAIFISLWLSLVACGLERMKRS